MTTATDAAFYATLAYTEHRIAAEEAAQAFHYWSGVRDADTAVRNALGDAFWESANAEVRDALNTVWAASLERSRQATATADAAYQHYQKAARAAKAATADALAALND